MEIKETYAELAVEFKKTRSDKAYTKLYHKMYPNLRNYIFNIVKDLEVADDLLSETMSKVYTKIDQYDPERGQISTWTYRIAYNEALHWIRARNKKVSLSYYADKGYEISNTKMDIGMNPISSLSYEMDEIKTKEEYLEEDDKLEFKYQAALEEIHNLKPMYREIIYDRLVNEMSYRDIEMKHNSPFMKQYRQLINDFNIAKRKNLDTRVIQSKIKEFKKHHIISEQTIKNRLNRGKQLIYEKLNVQIDI